MTNSQSDSVPAPSMRDKVHSIIFGAETPAGKWFDILLLAAILLSVVGFCLQTVNTIESKYGNFLHAAEWVFTILFTIEYLTRLYCVKRPLNYVGSFWGLIDLFSFLPTYLGLFFANTPSFAVIRAFRLLRVFRILKLGWFMREADELGRAMLNARAKIVVFIIVVLISVTVAGTLMYEVENRNFFAQPPALHPAQVEVVKQVNDQLAAVGLNHDDLVLEQKSKFTNIPEAMYWATVTMTTVGYGDIVPVTVLGKIIATMLILLGYSLIIVPTGFVSAAFIKQRKQISNRTCSYCITEGHDADARFCKYCGEEMSVADFHT